MNENAADIGDLIEPGTIGFSFAAPGWYVVGVLLVLLLMLVIILVWRNYARNRYRRDALRYVLALENEIQDQNILVYEVNMMLKRIALRFTPRENLASLRNEQWIEFLNTTGKSNLFSETLTGDLFQALYTRAVTQQSANDFLLKAKQWIRVHKARHEKSMSRQSVSSKRIQKQEIYGYR